MKNSAINFIDKYLPSQDKLNYLIKFILSYSNTVRERYDKVEFENLYSYNAPLYFEEYETLKYKTSNDKNFNIKTLENIKFFLPLHLSITMDRKNPDSINKYCFLKMNNSFFLIEVEPKFNIKILLPFHTEKFDMESYKEDFDLFLLNLKEDFKF